MAQDGVELVDRGLLLGHEDAQLLDPGAGAVGILDQWRLGREEAVGEVAGERVLPS